MMRMLLLLVVALVDNVAAEIVILVADLIHSCRPRAISLLMFERQGTHPQQKCRWSVQKAV